MTDVEMIADDLEGELRILCGEDQPASLQACDRVRKAVKIIEGKAGRQRCDLEQQAEVEKQLAESEEELLRLRRQVELPIVTVKDSDAEDHSSCNGGNKPKARTITAEPRTAIGWSHRDGLIPTEQNNDSDVEGSVREPEADVTFEAWYRRHEDIFTIDAQRLDGAILVRLLLHKLDAAAYEKYVNNILPVTFHDAVSD
ncbi:unnamed protein product [Heligmosomoides polygyrus]|uniref:Helicase_PWI domain-containing protein n=1 Tax=Heligmosomoides polygyrus TaxID=6339 RepID=A0A183G6N7_HELPZ|nr:unnamed protein product [Heligmosomoides polygyrus]